MRNLSKLNDKVNTARDKYLSTIDEILMELQNVTGENFIYNDFASDGLAFTLEGMDTYMSITAIIKVINEKGTFTVDDLDTTF